MKKRYIVLIIGILVVVVLVIKFQTSETDCFGIYDYGDYEGSIYDAYSEGHFTEQSMKKAIRCGCAKYSGYETLGFIGKYFYETDPEYRNHIDDTPYLFAVEVPKWRRLIC